MSILRGVVYRGRVRGVGRGNDGRGRTIRDEDNGEAGDVRDTGAVHDKFDKAGAATTAEGKPTTAVGEGIEDEQR